MPTTRRQAAIAEGKIHPEEQPKVTKKRSTSTTRKPGRPSTKKAKNDEDVEMQNGAGKRSKARAGRKRAADETEHDEEPPAKKTKTGKANGKGTADSSKSSVYKSGTIERGHLYFFYRPRVQVEEVHSIDDIRNFHMLLVPRPADNVPGEGADAVPASDNGKSSQKFYRLVTVGKKKLPDPQGTAEGNSRKKEIFYATVTAVGDDLHQLEKGLGGKSYETKTRGTRHEGAARLVARGGYAIVNSEGETPSQRETHLGYHVSHPTPADLADVQTSLGIFSASSFVLQIKNPLAPASSPQQAHSKPAEYPDWIMQDVFGKASGKGKKPSRGRDAYGLRFASCETPELLDYKGAELLLIASQDGEEGLENSLGKGRGKALTKKEEKEQTESVKQVFSEIGLDLEQFPVQSLEGSWI